MAASYSTGSASSPVDLLQKLVTWLVAQGWTQDMSQAVGSGWRAHLHKAGRYVHFRAAINEYDIWYYDASQSGYAGSGIGLYLGTGFSSGSAWNAQAGGPVFPSTSNNVGAGMMLPAGAIVAYHFFDDGADHVTVVVEKSAGLFVHMGWGPSLVKTGYTSDWWYFYASTPSYYNLYSSVSSYPGQGATAAAPMAFTFYYPNYYLACAFIRVDESVYSGRWVSLGNGTTGESGYTGRQGRSVLDTYGQMTDASQLPVIGAMADRGWQSAFTGALLLPMHCFAQASSGRWIPAGYPPTVFYCGGVGHGFAAGAVYQVGGLDYMLFPGFAVRKAA